MHFLVIEGVPNIVMVNIATLHISLLLARTSIFVSQKLVRSQFLVLVWILTAFMDRYLGLIVVKQKQQFFLFFSLSFFPLSDGDTLHSHRSSIINSELDIATIYCLDPFFM